MDGTDAAAFLTASPERILLLEHLGTEPDSPGELASALSLSRRSVQRNLVAFVERGWVRKVDGEYRRTTTGTLVARIHTDYVDALDRVGRFAPFYEHLPDVDHAPDPSWLAGADLATATEADPHAALELYVSRVEELPDDRILMVSPVLSRPIHRAHEPLALDGVHTELVMTEKTVERARERNPAEFEVVATADVVDLYCHSGPIEVGLTVGNDRALVSAYDDDGNLRACVDADDDRLVEWATDRFERYRQESERVPGALDRAFDVGRE